MHGIRTKLGLAATAVGIVGVFIGAGPAAPVWSRDGTQIAFDRVYVRDGNPLSRDYVADVRTGRIRKLP